MGRRSAFDKPALTLANDLQRVGRPDLHHRIVEALRDDPLTDDHVGEVQERLVEVLNDPRVAERDKNEARRLIAVGDDLLGAIGRCGVVHMTWRRIPTSEPGPVQWARPVLAEDEGIYQGSWGGEESYELSPEFTSLDEALMWARVRAPSVIVRPWWDNGTEYWAGDGPPPERYRELERPH
ncbi:hypothetical protein L1080_003950 [Rhodococcus sp. MSC1_016]|jgi:hypothetical protein|uniref:hypothetical protein n=1 Tax=Rhodococcus sp. MSC1_016 TaxID=2909266 RepID=UPI0020300790|nr:hypothetical protein [Rhodococcus sp. MSC1_016]